LLLCEYGRVTILNHGQGILVIYSLPVELLYARLPPCLKTALRGCGSSLRRLSICVVSPLVVVNALLLTNFNGNNDWHRSRGPAAASVLVPRCAINDNKDILLGRSRTWQFDVFSLIATRLRNSHTTAPSTQEIFGQTTDRFLQNTFSHCLMSTVVLNIRTAPLNGRLSFLRSFGILIRTWNHFDRFCFQRTVFIRPLRPRYVTTTLAHAPLATRWPRKHTTPLEPCHGVSHTAFERTLLPLRDPLPMSRSRVTGCSRAAALISQSRPWPPRGLD
jgi:hypothetical protein